MPVQYHCYIKGHNKVAYLSDLLNSGCCEFVGCETPYEGMCWLELIIAEGNSCSL
jgi:hypothetical protein